jgi:trehalose/maltose transport system substrate-binding protein
MDLPMPLVAYIGALAIFSLCLTWILNRGDYPFDALVAALSALVAAIGIVPVLNYPEVDLWLSLLVSAVTAALMAWMVYQELALRRRRRVWLGNAFFGIGVVLLFWNDYENNINGVEIAVALSTVREDQKKSIDLYMSEIWELKAIDKFKNETGASVKIVGVYPNIDGRLGHFLDLLKSKSSETPPSGKMVHVFAIDVIWPGIMAKYAEDLTGELGDIGKFNRSIIANNTVDVHEGGKVVRKLVAAPWYSDAGLLFYRKDLLEEYDDKNDAVEGPSLETWRDLEEMARKIQEGERAKGHKDFWGFVWQGVPSEPLTCNAMEWQISHGGGVLVDSDRNVDIDEARTAAALDRAKSWIDGNGGKNGISPRNIHEHAEAESFDIWKDGKAAFMRNWPYAYLASIKYFNMEKQVGVRLLPKDDNSSHPAATLGGWQLMVNAASSGKERKAAIRFVQFMTRKDIQKSLAMDEKGGNMPALVELYQDPEILEKFPFIRSGPVRKLFDGSQKSDILALRPSTPAADLYPQVSAIYREEVSAVLKGHKQALDGVKSIKNRLRVLLQ